jgi:hypothetical protein
VLRDTVFERHMLYVMLCDAVCDTV